MGDFNSPILPLKNTYPLSGDSPTHKWTNKGKIKYSTLDWILSIRKLQSKIYHLWNSESDHAIIRADIQIEKR